MRCTQIPVSALAEERLILTEEHCPYRNILEKALLPHGINPFSGIEVMSLEALKQMVRFGLGIGIMPTDEIASLPPKTIARSISELDLKLPVGIVFQSEASFPGSVLNSLVLDLTPLLVFYRRCRGFCHTVSRSDVMRQLDDAKMETILRSFMAQRRDQLFSILVFAF